MSALTLASAAEDATALAAAEAHHARLAAELAGRVALLLTAADRDPLAAESLRAGLVTFCDRDLLPHAAAEETVLYPAAYRLPAARLLIEALVAEHRCLTALTDALRSASGPAAAADARALQVLYEEHAAKENGLLLSLLAMAPDVSLAALLAEADDRLGTLDGPHAAGHGVNGHRGAGHEDDHGAGHDAGHGAGHGAGQDHRHDAGQHAGNRVGAKEEAP
ncbi:MULTISPECIES: hemerythrin domain-containing protein [unclassified Streptomyces]|uniref:hemerythrin domain-containing protein n=1 Tax=unclassified Streptomyces TaxID=2593676 RepID=UPI003D743810